jgi:hypothetical protein
VKFITTGGVILYPIVDLERQAADCWLTITMGARRDHLLIFELQTWLRTKIEFLRIQSTIPKRIVLRFNVKYELKEVAIIKVFFALFGLKPTDDFYSHLCAPNLSSKIHIILDLHYQTNSTVDLYAIEHEVFNIKKNSVLYIVLYLEGDLANQQVSHFKRLNNNTYELTRRRSHTLS